MAARSPNADLSVRVAMAIEAGLAESPWQSVFLM